MTQDVGPVCGNRISMKAMNLKEQIARVCADLREAFEALSAERVVKQKMLAEGLIAPAIRRLEALPLEPQNSEER